MADPAALPRRVAHTRRVLLSIAERAAVCTIIRVATRDALLPIASLIPNLKAGGARGASPTFSADGAAGAIDVSKSGGTRGAAATCVAGRDRSMFVCEGDSARDVVLYEGDEHMVDRTPEVL